MLASVVGCGGSKSNQESPESLPAAREAIRSLPYRIGAKVVRIGGTTVLVGSAKPESGAAFRFYLAAGHNAPNSLIRQIGHTLEGGGITPNYVLLTPIEEAGRQGDERGKIERAVQQSLCRQATGKSCAI